MDGTTDPTTLARARWNHEHPSLPWEQLTAGQRQGLVIQQASPEEAVSEQGLRVQLRKARIDIAILERKLAEANRKLEQYRISAELAKKMGEEPSCP